MKYIYAGSVGWALTRRPGKGGSGLSRSGVKYGLVLALLEGCKAIRPLSCGL